MTAAEASFGRRDHAAPANDLRSLARTGVPPVVLLYLFCVVIPIAFQVGPILLTTLRLLTMVMIIPLTVNLLRGKYGRLILTDILFFAHFTWIAVALYVNNPDRVVEQVGSLGPEFLGGYLLGRACIRTPETFAALCRILIILVLFSTPFAIYETQTGRPIIVEYLRRIPGMTSVAIITIEERMGLERVQATFAHPIHFGLFCSVAFSLCYVAMQGLISNVKRYTASILILCTGLTALSSGALLAMVMQIILIGWYTVFQNQQKRWWILVGLAVAFYVSIDLASNRSPLRVFMSYATFSAHNAYYRGIIFDWGLANIIGSTEKGVVGSPIFGIGLKDWVRPWFMHTGSVDNFWLVIGLRYGLPGFFTLAIGYILVISRVMRRDFSNSLTLTQFRRAWIFTFLGLTFTLCTVHVWTNVYSFVTFMFGAGVWFIKAEVSETSQNGAETDRNSQRSLSFTRFSRSRGSRESGELSYARKTAPLASHRTVT